MVLRVALPTNRNPSIVGVLPTVIQVKLFQVADVIELIGLSVNQLREWTSPCRRKLPPTDIGLNDPIRHALYSWQAVLVLILRRLCDEIAVENGGCATWMIELRDDLKGAPFPSKRYPVLLPAQTNEIRIGVVIALDPNFLLIATNLSLRPADQLFLFSVHAVE